MLNTVNRKKSAIFYSPHYNLDLGRHVFPAEKYGYIYDRIKKDYRYDSIPIIAPDRARMEDIELVHTFSYLEDLFSYEHTFRTMHSELPLNRSIVESFQYGVGGTVAAMEATSEYMFCFNTGGGYHHSFPDRAEGFCYLNDVAIATKLYLYQNPNSRVLIADLDLHQGNGNSLIFQGDDSVFTFSMHQENIYPKKETSDLDIPLSPGIQDEEYLSLLEEGIRKIESSFQPDLIFYLAGADPYEDDSLGELKVSMNGLKERDRIMKALAKKKNIPCVVVTAGGYARNPQDTVQIHMNTLEVFCIED
jgi:acetoin utilization deacetylase AcuC-like enzyme